MGRWDGTISWGFFPGYDSCTSICWRGRKEPDSERKTEKETHQTHTEIREGERDREKERGGESKVS